MIRFLYGAACVLMLSACGYHLVGQGNSSEAVPSTADSLWVQMLNSHDDALLNVAQRALLERTGLQLAHPDEPSATLLTIYIEHAQENLQVTSFDASGVANQYRLTISGNIRVLYQGEERWQSGQVSVQGDVFATGGAVAIEAQRESLAKSLRKSWVEQVMRQMYSGF